MLFLIIPRISAKLQFHYLPKIVKKSEMKCLVELLYIIKGELVHKIRNQPGGQIQWQIQFYRL